MKTISTMVVFGIILVTANLWGRSAQAAHCQRQVPAVGIGEVLEAAMWNTEWDNVYQCASDTETGLAQKLDLTGGTLTGNVTLQDADIFFLEGVTTRITLSKTGSAEFFGDVKSTNGNISVTTGKKYYFDNGVNTYFSEIANEIVALILNGNSLFEFSTAGLLSRRNIAFDDTACLAATGNSCRVDDVDVSDLAANVAAIESNPFGSSIESAEITDSTITANDMGADSVASDEIAANAVTTAEVADSTLTGSDVQDDSLKGDDIDESTLTLTIDDNDLGAQSVYSVHVVDDTLTSNDLAADSVTASEIAVDAVGTAEVADGTLTGGDMQDNTLTGVDIHESTLTLTGLVDDDDLATNAVDGGNGGEIQDGTVTFDDIADNTVTDNDVAPGAIGASEVADDSLTGADIDESTLVLAIDDNDLGPQSVYSIHVADGTLTSADLGTDSVTASEIATDAVTTDKVDDDTLKGDDVLDNTLTGDDIDESSLVLTGLVDNDDIQANAVDGGNGGEIEDGTVSFDDIADNTITDNDVAPGAIGASEVADDSLTGTDIDESTLVLAIDDNDLGPQSVYSVHVVDGTLTSADLGTDSVTASEIATDAVTTDKVDDDTLKGDDVLDNTLTGDDIDESSLVLTNLVDDDDLKANAVDGGNGGEIQDNTIVDNDLAAGSVGSLEIADGSIATVDLNTTSLDNSYVRRDGTMSMTGTLTINTLAANLNSLVTDGTAILGGNVGVGGSLGVGGNAAINAMSRFYLDGTSGNTFLSEIAANNFRLVVGGLNAIDVASSLNTTFGGHMIMSAGNSFFLDNTGATFFTRPTVNSFRLVVGGLTALDIASSLNMTFGGHMIMAVGNGFFVDGGVSPNDYIWQPGTDSMGFVLGGNTTLRLYDMVNSNTAMESANNNATGINWYFQNTNTTNIGALARMNISSGSDSAGDAYIRTFINGSTEWSFGVDNSDGNSWKLSRDGSLGNFDFLRMGTDGGLAVAGTVRMQTAYSLNVVDGTQRTLLINSNGVIGTNGSSIRFKENVTDLDFDTPPLWDLSAVSFNYIGSDVRVFGFIAEEVNEILPELVTYDEDGQPFGVKYEMLAVLLLQESKKLKNQVEENSLLISELVNRLGKLEKKIGDDSERKTDKRDLDYDDKNEH